MVCFRQPECIEGMLPHPGTGNSGAQLSIASTPLAEIANNTNTSYPH
jgi:hypothetical protein